MMPGSHGGASVSRRPVLWGACNAPIVPSDRVRRVADIVQPGQEVEVTLLTINETTRRITGSIQHVADIPPEELEQYTLEGDVGSIGDALEDV